MISISKIDPDFEIYKNNSVVIWGNTEAILEMIDLLEYFNINIVGVCEEAGLNSKSSQEKLTINNNNSTLIKIYKNIPVITIEELKNLHDKDNNLLVQIAMNSVFEMLVLAKIQMLGINKYISTQETINFLGAYKKVLEINKNPMLNNPLVIKTLKNNLIKDLEHKSIEYINNTNTTPLLLCLPPKTGDNTLDNTFNSKNIKHYNYWHTPKSFNSQKILEAFNNNNFKNKKHKKIKIITGLREPIAQNISLFYSTLSLLNYTNNDYLLRLFENSEFLTKNNRDAQTFFDIWLDETNYLNYDKQVYLDENSEHRSKFNTIQYFIPQFQNNILDILAYEFDKEKGYSIINNKNLALDLNIEVFVYQLEKMNNLDLIQDLNKWILSDLDLDLDLDLKTSNNIFGEWLIGNSTSNKWIANSYSQAQKELKFSKKYFEKCFSEEYLGHFYLEKDIKKFKEKYKNNIL